MRQALQLAYKALEIGEVPIGAILVFEDQIISKGFNSSILECDPTAHAEIIALRRAAKFLNNYRLVGSTLYVTVEPCLMCVGAMLHARIHRLVFGASDPKVKFLANLESLKQQHKINHQFIYEGGVLADESRAILQDFFIKKRLVA